MKYDQFIYLILTHFNFEKELMKLRKKISTTVQTLSHIKEKLHFINEKRIQAAETLAEKENEVKQV